MKQPQLPTVRTYLQQFTPAHLADLRRFAEWRLRRISAELPPEVTLALTAEDLVQDVLLDTWRGDYPPDAASLTSPAAFLDWLRRCLDAHLTVESHTCLCLCSALSLETPPNFNP